jgi:UDPglucose 6-dehydrogenase/GDP-mannose 6-dehydrogenase
MRVAIVGSGYVGLVSGVGLAAAGHDVACADVDAARVARIQAGESPIHEPGLTERLRQALRAGRFRATAKLEEALAGSRVSLIAVGTPARDGRIDLSQVEAAAARIGELLPRLRPDHVVAVKSTVVPGTTDGLVRGLLERHSQLGLGEFGLASNPEFLREGSAVEDFLHPDRILIGAATPESAETLLALYREFDCPKLVTTPRNAELAKYASNALLATLISFSNELARLCEAIPGTDVDTVLDGLALDRRLSPLVDGRRVEPGILAYLRAGAGFGGSCLPKDVLALRAEGAARGVPVPLLEAVLSVNARRAEDLVRLLECEVGPLEGATVALLGLAFKPGTDDLRDSPALRLASLLRARGAHVRAWDPVVCRSAARGPLPAELADVELCGELEAALCSADAALVATAWPELREARWDTLAASMRTPVLLDGRGALAGLRLPRSLRYRPIGQASAPVGRAEQASSPGRQVGQASAPGSRGGSA